MTATLPLRAPRPVPGPSRAYHFPPVERFALPNGLAVVVAPIPRLPIVTALAVVDAGAMWDAPGREGVAQLVAKLLLEGAGDLSGSEMAERLEQLGASIESSADWDAAVVSMTVTSAHLEAAFDRFVNVLRRPTFPSGEFERLKSERMAELLQLRAEPRGLADEAFAAAVYDGASRYATPEGGTEASVQTVGLTDLTHLYAERYGPRTTTLIVAGDITADEVRGLAHRCLGDWSGGALRGAPGRAEPLRNTRATVLVDKEDAPQSELRMGHVGVPRTHPDYFDIVVMNAIFGGLFNSRINLNLREAHAYTYGAFSAFEWRCGPGPFLISTAVSTESTADSIAEVLTEVNRIRTDPVSREELSLATSYLDGVFPIRFETTEAVATALANQTIFGLPDDYFNTYRSRIRAVSTESVLSAAQRHLDPDRMQAVVVGNAAVIRDALKALHFGTYAEGATGAPPTPIDPGEVR